ncbi:hypothetical protein EYZ11_002049 [Aspergillus tanneri]|uniref:Major facilitator superfamily (MFS) profile domain-containing protein n=1 Tax=Aspergillus tanneri TaxID=1220188 RepID=A0A4V3UQF2_9EURO|nr:uncharacterized protein ATNIH1004_007299 [Aspergillus tanneri]KAA8645878.1 hypothetical protein ATNIH1004_007299 [Aspergillus tanneri]THC98464.1 hypothetical protein EYZ11_002049 [Aspergillus tanneri]
MGASTALLCVGSSLALWITGRLFQGASAAVVWTVGMALLTDNVDSDELGGAMGLASMGMTLGVMIGPLLGGILYQHAGYYAVFGLAFSFIGFDIFFRLVMIEKKDAAKWLPNVSLRIPPNQTDREHGILESHIYDSDRQEDLPTDSFSVYIASTPEKLPVSSHSKAENGSSSAQPGRRSTRLLTLLRSRRLAIALYAYFTQATCIMCFDSILPLFVRDTFGWGQAGQGLIFIPLSLPHIGDPFTGFIIDRWPQSRVYLAAGGFLVTVPLLTCLRFVSENSLGDKALLCVLLALIGVMGGVLEPPIMVEITHVIEQKEAKFPEVFGKGGGLALGYGVMNAAWAAGGLIGPIYGGFIRDSAGWNTTTWALGALMAVPGVLLLFLLRID